MSVVSMYLVLEFEVLLTSFYINIKYAEAAEEIECLVVNTSTNSKFIKTKGLHRKAVFALS